MLRRHKFVIRTICIAGLLGLLVFAVDLAEAWRSLRAADPFLVVLALGLVQGQIVLSAVRWRFTAGRLGHHLGYGTAVAEYYLASLLNLALPGGVGGDAVRAARAGAARPVGSAVTGPVILRAVVLERLAGQMAFLLLATIGIALWPALIDGEAPARAARRAILALAIIALLAGVTAFFARFGPEPTRVWFARLGPDVVEAWFRKGAWLVQGSLSIVIAALYIAVFVLASAAIGAPLPWQFWLAGIPLVLLTMLLPVSIGGFGLREGAAAALWPLAGYAASEGLAASVLYGLISLAGALPALLVLMSRRQGAERRRA
jgi:glycosyltransferase 2 family protein